MLRNDFLWVEKYRPKTINDCILPDTIKKTFQDFLEAGEIPNLLLSGPPGVGKTTVARALSEELGSDYIVINGSDEGRFLDTVRNQAKNFASTVSLQQTGVHKVIIIDEADNTTHDVQLLLRANIESFYKNCRFIFTCNYKNKIIAPLHSRCSVIDFQTPSAEKPQIARAFFTRIKDILDIEKIKYEEKVVAAVVQKFYPDFRRTLNELQRYSSSGRIDTGILGNSNDIHIASLNAYLKKKEFTNMKKWVTQNMDNDPVDIMRIVYDNLYSTLEGKSIPEAVLIIAEYQYKSAFVVDQEINMVAFLTEIMMRCEFK